MIFLFFIVLGLVSSLVDDCPLDGVKYMNSSRTICHQVEGCHELLEDNSCEYEECLYGYYWNNVTGECEECAAGAYECLDSVTSISCYTGYYLSNDQCLACSSLISDCSNCSQQGEEIICHSCATSYFSLNQNGSFCVDCRNPLYVGYDNKAASCSINETAGGTVLSVKSCIDGWVVITENDPYICRECRDGGVTGSDYYGTECIQSSPPGSPATINITECANGFCLYSSGATWKCYNTGFFASIVKCSYDGTYFTASKCSVGKGMCMLSGNTGCYDCRNTGNGGSSFAQNCIFNAACDTVLAVTSCTGAPLTTVLYNFSCYFCGSNCGDCTYNITSAQPECNKCKDVEKWERGYFVDPVNHTCQICPSGCHSCNSENKCTKCVSVKGKKGCYNVCSGDWKGKDCDVCGPGVCLNGGNCSNNGSSCYCQGMWKGPVCDIEIQTPGVISMSLKLQVGMLIIFLMLLFSE